MFGHRFFPQVYFGPRYFGPVPGAAVVSTHDGGDGFTKKELDALRHRHHQAARATEDTRRQAEKRLSDALRKAFSKVLGPAPEWAALERIAEAAGLPEPAQSFDWGILGADLEAAKRAIAALETEMFLQAQAEALRRFNEQDEDDLELLLLAA